MIFGPAKVLGIGDKSIRELLADLLDKEGVKRASKAVSDRLGVPKNRVYALALEMKNARDS